MANYINAEGITDKKELLAKLRQAVDILNQMGGALYQSILIDDCKEIAQKCRVAGCTAMEIHEVGGWPYA